MAEGNWIKLYRKMIDDPVFVNSTPAQVKVLLTVMFLAAWAPKKWDVLGHEFTIQPGEVFISSLELARRAGDGVSRKVVRGALERFEKLGFWTIQRAKRGALIHIVNWGKYQLYESDEGQSMGHTRANGGPMEGQWRANGGPTNKKESKNSKNVRREEGKKGAPSPVLEKIRDYELAHHSPALTAALVDWARMRKADRCSVKAEDIPDLLQQVTDLSGGSVDKAVAIVRQSIDRHWKQFWALKDPPARASPSPRYQPVERANPSAPPPPRIEDYPGDPEGFRRDAAAWASAYGVDNRRIEKKYSEGTPTDEERERILKAMGH